MGEHGGQLMSEGGRGKMRRAFRVFLFLDMRTSALTCFRIEWQLESDGDAPTISFEVLEFVPDAVVDVVVYNGSQQRSLGPPLQLLPQPQSKPYQHTQAQRKNDSPNDRNHRHDVKHDDLVRNYREWDLQPKDEYRRGAEVDKMIEEYSANQETHPYLRKGGEGSGRGVAS